MTQDNETIINLELYGDLVEDICGKLKDMAKKIPARAASLKLLNKSLAKSIIGTAAREFRNARKNAGMLKIAVRINFSLI